MLLLFCKKERSHSPANLLPTVDDVCAILLRRLDLGPENRKTRVEQIWIKNRKIWV